MADPAHRQRVAAQLKRIRESLGASGEEVATALGWSQPKVSRVENGRIAVNNRDLGILLHYYGVPEDVRAELMSLNVDDDGIPGVWVVRAGGPTRRQGEVADIETRVTEIRQYYPLMIPGQLQSSEYALAYTRAGRWPNPEAIVSRRMRRQNLLSGADSPKYVALLDARAFLTTYGSTEVMMGQLAHVRHRATLPNVEIRIIPLNKKRSSAAMGPFTLYDFEASESRRVVFIETQTTDIYLSADSDVEAYTSTFDRLEADALDVTESIEHLAWLGNHIEDQKGQASTSEESRDNT